MRHISMNRIGKISIGHHSVAYVLKIHLRLNGWQAIVASYLYCLFCFRYGQIIQPNALVVLIGQLKHFIDCQRTSLG